LRVLVEKKTNVETRRVRNEQKETITTSTEWRELSKPNGSRKAGRSLRSAKRNDAKDHNNRLTQEGKRNDGSRRRRAEGHTLLSDAAEINDAQVESEGGVRARIAGNFTVPMWWRYAVPKQSRGPAAGTKTV